MVRADLTTILFLKKNRLIFFLVVNHILKTWSNKSDRSCLLQKVFDICVVLNHLYKQKNVNPFRERTRPFKDTLNISSTLVVVADVRLLLLLPQVSSLPFPLVMILLRDHAAGCV
jgi:hypothetical protein